jgi:hypothetical protein
VPTAAAAGTAAPDPASAGAMSNAARAQVRFEGVDGKRAVEGREGNLVPKLSACRCRRIRGPIRAVQATPRIVANVADPPTHLQLHRRGSGATLDLQQFTTIASLRGIARLLRLIDRNMSYFSIENALWLIQIGEY